MEARIARKLRLTCFQVQNKYHYAPRTEHLGISIMKLDAGDAATTRRSWIMKPEPPNRVTDVRVVLGARLL
jgi:hypothetical protein